MKIGIVTFQYAYNYGAILQLAALQRLLKKMGHESIAINFLPPESKDMPFWRGWGFFKGNLITGAKKRIIQLQYTDAIKSKFNLFKRLYISLSNPCYNAEDVSRVVLNYDAVITGSDQVWHFNNSSIYFLEWGKDYSGIKISYAPSCGIIDQPIYRFQEIKRWIQNIDHLSVRDEASKYVIEKVSGCTPKIVADPTLLVDLEDMKSPIKIPYKYIFAYILGTEIKGGNEEMIKIIKKHFKDLPIIALVASAHKPQLINWADHIIWDAGPAEWLQLVSNSSFVYTDSYHCSLFAIKYHKPFLAYYTEERRSSRLLDIEKRFGISQSIVKSIEEALDKEFWNQKFHEKILWDLNLHIDDSIKFLKESLQ